MQRTLLIFLATFMFTVATKAQTAADALVLKIPQAYTYDTRKITEYIKENFSTDTARLRAVYVWITNNIQYDLVKLQSRTSNTTTAVQTVADVLQTRKAVCQGYADLFVELCNGLGIKTHFIGGYTKKDGVVNNLPHAWVGVESGGKWFLFDPTWGAGYVQNNQFVRAPNQRYYKLTPDEMIKEHMPFDPMYQFLQHPITNKEFIEGNLSGSTSRPIFHFSDTLKQYALLAPDEKMKSEARRLEASGIRNDLLLERLNFLKKGVEPFAFNDANTTLKRAVDLFNQYIDHRNKQFSNIDDKDLQQLMDSVSHNAAVTRTLLSKVSPGDAAQKQVVANTYQNLEKFQVRIMKEKEFVARYLSTDKATRRQLFTRG